MSVGTGSNLSGKPVNQDSRSETRYPRFLDSSIRFSTIDAARAPMLITNKDKRSKKADSKRDAARRIRHSFVEVPERPVHKSPKRHNQNACPLCYKAIGKTASGGRRKHSCEHCGACLDRGITCLSCGTNRMWHGKLGSACQGCGTALAQVIRERLLR